MRTEPELASRRPDAYDWDAEREVDFRRWWDGLVARWGWPAYRAAENAKWGEVIRARNIHVQ